MIVIVRAIWIGALLFLYPDSLWTNTKKTKALMNTVVPNTFHDAIAEAKPQISICPTANLAGLVKFHNSSTMLSFRFVAIRSGISLVVLHSDDDSERSRGIRIYYKFSVCMCLCVCVMWRLRDRHDDGNCAGQTVRKFRIWSQSTIWSRRVRLSRRRSDTVIPTVAKWDSVVRNGLCGTVRFFVPIVTDMHKNPGIFWRI